MGERLPAHKVLIHRLSLCLCVSVVRFLGSKPPGHAFQLTADRTRRAMQAAGNWLLPRIIGIRRSGVYLQTTIGNLGLIAATLLKKL